MSNIHLKRLRNAFIRILTEEVHQFKYFRKINSITMAVTPPSPPGDVLPLKEFNMLYQLSPSISATSTTSPLPDVAYALTQYQNEILGGPPVSLAWKNLRVMIQMPKGSSQAVLDDISGFAEPFTMVAILGPPRSGKTMLLEAIAGRLSRFATLEGEILVNGRRQQLTYGTAAYLTPEDIFIDTLTVRETLYFSALLKLPHSMSMKQKVDKVDQIISDMGLKDCAATYVGNRSSKGISKGQRRCLSLAMELLMQPRLLYFDEPTDGLNSSASLLLLTKLKILAREGRTIVVCIREPNNDVFQLFDYLLILDKGKTIYFGEACSAAEHFARNGLPNPTQWNPINYFLHMASAEYEEVQTCFKSLQDLENICESRGDDTKDNVKCFAAMYQSSEISAKVSAKINEISTKKGAVLVNLGSHAGIAIQIAVLTYRSFLNMTRDLSHYWMRLAFSTVLMLVIGTMFIKMSHSINSIQERASCLFVVLEIMIFSAIGGMPSYFHEMKVFVRERINCHYHVTAFVIGNTISSLPILLMITLVSSCIVYFLVGLHLDFMHFVYFVLNVYASLIVMEGLVMTISAVAPNFYVGMILGSFVQIISMLVAGFFCRPRDIPNPIWTYPISYLSFHRYAIWGLYQNEFLGVRFEHSSTRMSGEHVIWGIYHMRYPGKWKNLLILFCIAIFYRIVFFSCIKLQEQLSHILKTYKMRSQLNGFHDDGMWEK